MKETKKKITTIIIIMQIVVLLGVSIIPIVKFPFDFLQDVRKETSQGGRDKEMSGEDSGQKKEENQGDSQEDSLENQLTITPEVQEKLDSMTLEEKIAQLFIITPEELTGIGTATAAGETTMNAINNRPVGGLHYASKNIYNPVQLQDMLSKTQEYSQSRIGLSMFIGVNEDGENSPFVENQEFTYGEIESAAEIGAGQDTEAAYRAGQNMGSFLAEQGINYTLAPMADITLAQESVTAGQTFGTDQELVGTMVSSQTEGLQDNGVSAVLKYFPGKGGTTGTNASGFPMTSRTLSDMEEQEFKVYEKGIEAGADFIMVGHIVAEEVTGDQTPASMSEKMVTDILRKELGYKGIILSESLSGAAIVNNYSAAEAAVNVLKAGADMIFLPSDFEEAYQGVLAAVADGTLSEERIEASVVRVLMEKME